MTEIKIELFVAADNQVYQAIVQDGLPLFTVSPTSKDASRIEFWKLKVEEKLVPENYGGAGRGRRRVRR